MSTAQRLAAFQRAAVDHIVARLQDPKGSRRFLLADEVGLGKTVVARSVIDRLAARQSGRPCTVVYLCSNAEISEQNRRKLADGGGHTVRRVTELAVRQPPKTPGEVVLYAFTPNTSLKGGTGLAQERRLLLFLLEHVLGFDTGNHSTREYFRCGVNEDRWERGSERSQLRADFLWKVPERIQQAFRDAVREHDPRLLLELRDGIKRKAQRYALISRCRVALQRATLEQIEPDLVVLDEVQRFRDIIDTLDKKESLARALIGPTTRTLILSATPYRMLSLSTDAAGTDHHEEFHATLRFLCGKHTEIPARVKRAIEAFGEQLKVVDLASGRDERLLELKRTIEQDLRQIMCRTERNWYFDEHSGALHENGDRVALPSLPELQELVALEHGLRGQLSDVGQITDFWKSCPSVLTFMDRGYALHRRLTNDAGGHRRRAAVPAPLITSAGDPALSRRHQRMQAVLRHTVGDGTRAPLLWTAPTLRYMSSDAFGAEPPRKMLVFSGWRFVPKAVAVVASQAVEARLRRSGEASKQPLQLKTALSSHVLDVCLPSLALATSVDPLALSQSHGTLPSETQLLELAVNALRERFAEVGIREAPRGSLLPWQAVMYLEHRLGFGDAFRDTLAGWQPPRGNDPWPTRRHADRLTAWLDGSPALSITRERLRRLALVALGSPAVCLARTAVHLYGVDAARAALPHLWTVGFEALRAYFNRPVVQQAVRMAAGTRRRRRGGRHRAGGYSVQVLEYSLRHELQAVLDEHGYLAYADGGRDTVQAFAEHYGRIWSLEPGMRRTNAARKRGKDLIIGAKGERWATHFALAFGDELKSEPADDGGTKPLRRSDIREAFNSPFWPFVLATTSVGQEGLDFHWYCRDVFHWNLPANPVDLEQREGRVNRRHGLAVRQSIAQDWSLARLAGRVRTRNPWVVLFEALEDDVERQRYKQGLYPHWIYECADSAQTRGIVRHVCHFRASRDADRYQMLKERLALYRLVFGQAQQEHLLGDLHDRLRVLPEEKQIAARHALRGYMLNLSPISREEALEFAREEAEQLIATPEQLGSLCASVEALLQQHAAALAPVRDRVAVMLALVDAQVRGATVRRDLLRNVVTALVYLRNPYDQYFDVQAAGGWDDDLDVIRAVRLPTADDWEATPRGAALRDPKVDRLAVRELLRLASETAYDTPL
jgi:hypothetical protein